MSSLIGWSIRNILWPYMERKKGNKIRSYMAEMKKFQSLSKQEISQYQSERLGELLKHAMKNVPAYQDLDQELIRSIDNPAEAIQHFPILTKKYFNQNSESYIANTADRSQLIANRTGGSTGEPTKFYLDRVTVEHFEAARWLGLSWSGIQIGDRSIMVWGSSIELSKNQSQIHQLKEVLLKNRTIISAYDLREENIKKYLDEIHSFKPIYLYGYPSALALLAELMIRNNLRLQIKLNAVVTTAETLQPQQREVIQKAFDCNVINEYGARDGGIIAYECPKGHMHISTKNCYLEVVDIHTKEPVGYNEKGLLLVTDLNNYSMPRIRYQLGDVVSLSDQPCGCGNHLPILASLEGREDDVFVARDGSYVHGNYFNQVMWSLESFSGYQLIQHTYEDVSLKLVKNVGSHDFERDEQYFRNEIMKKLGDVYLSISFVDEIPRSSSGKIRYAVREFPLPSTLPIVEKEREKEYTTLHF
ncbi:capsular polysaccharide biosynthesis protein [Brevibacillus reuszeri]|uniref:Capsular polysaccharide biosynthesis protein n=3 Tax=Brevibacillus reuszeri TaxID=54915 RepID=A0ABQ0TTL3_9BACL|nr:phenylacetate--CoA ligase family protein [Brevibacillus reuszeri]GED71140.1 capsular polysaccharide biosynthesis protein [Brevibacillus reuszeri]